MVNEYRRYTPEQWTQSRPGKEYMAHYITYRPGMLDPVICDALKTAYDDNSQLQVLRAGEAYHFRQIDVTSNAESEPWVHYHASVITALQRGLEIYREDISYEGFPVVPTNFALEDVCINRSENNGKDKFLNHVDVENYNFARRCITMLFYLNDIEDGGDAAFPPLGISVKPTKGALLMFPSNWTYIHCGVKAVSTPKYIMTSFVHYLKPEEYLP